MPTRLSVLGVRIPENAIRRSQVLPVALGLVATLTVVEATVKLDFSLGIFYTIPVLMAGTVLTRTQIILFGVLCACARAPFTPSASELEGFLKFVMASIAFCASGLLVVEMSNNRRRLIEHYARLEMEQGLRRRAEEQLRLLAESSPAAILTLNASAEVLAANRAAHDMLGVPSGELAGQRVDTSLPMFPAALEMAGRGRSVRTSVTGWARRPQGQIFPVQAWFSVYGQADDRRLAAIVVDMSDEVRDRERENFQHLLDNNRILAGAVSHEIRNLCSAISVVCSNLGKHETLRSDADFEALTGLVAGLSRLASYRLRRKPEGASQRADLPSVLDLLRLVVEPDWDEVDGKVRWSVPDDVPAVAADFHDLLQIFLNLSQNSLRAVEAAAVRHLDIEVEVRGGEDVFVFFTDSGPGVSQPGLLFQPFRPEADGSGLGLYISRELARSSGGDLQHVEGSRFCVAIPVARMVEEATVAAD